MLFAVAHKSWQVRSWRNIALQAHPLVNRLNVLRNAQRRTGRISWPVAASAYAPRSLSE